MIRANGGRWGFVLRQRVLLAIVAGLALPAAALAQAPSVAVTYPNGGENVFVASSQTITWTSTGTIANVKIEFSANGGGTWSSIAARPQYR